jgi:glycosyltransferase involved in cell wall biosynthesis
VKKFVLYAPNVHTGGGFVLLRALLMAWPNISPLTLFLDRRAYAQLTLPQDAKVFWVTASVGSRLNAEFNLRKAVGIGDTVLCFHGLPPLLSSDAHIILFIQNRLFLEQYPLQHFKLKTHVRLIVERLIGRIFRSRVSECIVQTPSMQRSVINWYGEAGSMISTPLVRVMPFVDKFPGLLPCSNLQPEWDFVYVADGEAHKNHRNLLEAWELLAEEGLRPSLALTLSKRDEALCREIEDASAQNDLYIRNLGQLSRGDVMVLYTKARAMIFPSTLESFGLPLVEANFMGLPIISSELDYVRDVCVPVQTFDPHSPVSIARAVKRFLSLPVSTVELHTAEEFWRDLLGDMQK